MVEAMIAALCCIWFGAACAFTTWVYITPNIWSSVAAFITGEVIFLLALFVYIDHTNLKTQE